LKLRRFCAKCGKQLNDLTQNYPGFICASCYGQVAKDYALPLKFQFRRCLYCKAFSLKKKKEDQEYAWEYKPKDESDIDFLSRMLYSRILFHLEKKYNYRFELFIPQEIDLNENKIFSVQVHAKALEDIQNLPNKEIEIQMREIHCPHCAKKHGGRFDAIVQIRIQSSKDKTRLDEIKAEVNSIEKEENFSHLQNFISKMDSTINGFDMKVSTNGMAKVLIAKLRAKYRFEIKHSKKLMGVDGETGADLYRHSTLLRLVPVQRGDRIKIDNIAYEVKNTTKNRIVLHTIKGGKVKQVNFGLFQKKKWSFYTEEEDQDG
jgi:nonsense-mediated mRNA decay protein 3